MSKKNKRPWYHWLLIFLGGFLLVGLSFYIYIAWLLPLPESLFLRPRAISTKLYDRNGQLLYEVLSPGEGRKTYLKLSEMPELFKDAVIASEDSDFYNHPGVDAGAIARAIFYNFLEQKVSSGASTITQQLVRNLLGTNRERTLPEKLLETIYAIRISNAYSKDQVLEEYLNTVYFGNLSYGVAEAARNYFGKNLADLDLAEISLLAGLPKAPSTYNPLVNPEKARERQQYVLRRLVEKGYITEEQADEAAARTLHFASGKTAIAAPHFVHHVLAELEDQYGQDFIYGGLDIKTTLDLNLQKKAEQIVGRQLDKLQQKNVTNAAVLAATVPDGQILVWLGSRDYFNDQIDGQVDILGAARQPGSALKPFLYLLALERGDTLATIIEDLPIKVQTAGGVYAPLNYDLDFHGPVRLREALANSFNVPAVRTQEKLGTSEFLDFLRRLGLDTLNQPPDYYGLALTLGGGEVRMIDLANAYFLLANGGRQKPFNDILEISDANNNTIYKWQPASGKPLLGQYGEQNSWLITDTLADPNARLKSFGEGNVLELSIPAAAKTGTTRNFRDNWTFGFTPRLLTAVWVGNSDASPMQNISGIDGAGPIWHDLMTYYIEQNADRPGQTAASFHQPPGLIQKPVCAVSGLVPGDNCQEILNEWFVVGTEPRQLDYYWQKFICQSDVNASASSPSPSAQNAATRFYINYPFVFKSWAEQRGLLPPANCKIASLENQPADQKAVDPLQITSPLPGDSFQINNNLPLTSQKIPLKILVYPAALPGLSTAPSQIRLSIDGKILKTQDLSGTGEPLAISEFWLAERGTHTLQIQITASESQKLVEKAVQFQVE